MPAERPLYLPRDYDRILVVESLSALFNAPLGRVNCVLLPRNLSGDFNGLAQALCAHAGQSRESIMDRQMAEELFGEAPLSQEHQRLAATVLEDMKAVEAGFSSPRLRLVPSAGYQYRSSEAYAFHADTFKGANRGRLLCCYNEPVTEFVKNEDAILADQAEFTVRPDTRIYRFRVTDMWRQAYISSEGQEPFVHRAPPVRPDDPPRLLLVAN